MLDFKLFPSNSVGFVPMNLSSPDRSIYKSYKRNPLKFSPTARTKLLP